MLVVNRDLKYAGLMTDFGWCPLVPWGSLGRINGTKNTQREGSSPPVTFGSRSGQHTILSDLFVFNRFLDSTQEIYIPSDSQDTSLQTYTHAFSLELNTVEILTDLNLK